jgi:hypothetical protein
MSVWRRSAIFVIACTTFGSAAAVADQNPDADSREIAAYRLTLPNLKKVMNVNRSVFKAMMQDPKVQETLKIDAEIDAISKKADLTEADDKRLAELEARKEVLEEALDHPLGGETRSLDEMEARIKRYAPMQQALQAEGMAPREYAKFWMAFLQAAFAHGFQKSGMLKQLPADVNPENVKFIAEHEAEITAMQKEFEQFGKKQ